jgi:polar amino acid transport system substrate-binding protein
LYNKKYINYQNNIRISLEEEIVKRSYWSIISLALVSIILLSACGSSQNTAKKLRIASDATFPPFETVNESTKALEGFDIDLMTAIAKKENLDIEFVNVSFDPLLAGMAQCQYDAAISGITIQDDRKAKMLFSDPYMSAGQIISVKKDNTSIKGTADLKGKTLGAQLGTTGAIEAGKIEGATVKTYDSYDLAFLDLANGQVDAVIADYPTALAYVGKNADKIMTVGNAFTSEAYGIAVCNKQPDLLKSINEGLAAVKADGTFASLQTKWITTPSK